MSSVDTRVVEMKFNNNQFESGVKSVLSSLSALKNGLKLDNATKGINDISAATKGVNFSGMAAGVDNISSKFGALGAIGFSVIQNLTTSVMGFASGVLSKVLDPIIQGGEARALTIEQAKFQFEGLGMNIKDTMASAKAAVLGTAYGLADAAKAASLLGASGMKAGPKMVSSLRAIAGVAAMTGSAYNDISDVFTSVAGNGRLMGSDLLRLSSRGVNAAATLSKAMHKPEAEIRDMVTKGKISFQMFSDAMDGAFGKHAADANKTYTGALANMKAALSRLGADVATPKFEAQRKVLNAMSPVIDNIHKALMPLINAWGKFENQSSAKMVKMLKGLDLTWLTKSIPLVLAGIKWFVRDIIAIVTPIKKAFVSIFPPTMGNPILKLAQAFHLLSTRLLPSHKQVLQIQRTFQGLFSLLDIGWMLVKAGVNFFSKLFGQVSLGNGSILEFTASIGDWLTNLRYAIKYGNVFNQFFDKLAVAIAIPIAVLKSFGTLIKTAFDNIRGIDTGGLSGLGQAMQKNFEPLTKLADWIGVAWRKVGVALKAVWEFFAPMASAMSGAFKRLSTIISEALAKLTPQDVLSAINTGIFATVLVLFRNFFTKFKGLFTGQTKFTFMSSLKLNIAGLTNSLRVMQASLKAGVLLAIAIAIGILAASMYTMSKIDANKLAPALAAMSVLFVELAKTMTYLEKTMGAGGAGKLMALGVSIVLFALAIDILTTAVTKLSLLSWGDLVKGMLGVTVLIGALTLAAKGMSGVTGMAKTGAGLILLAFGIKILVSAVTDLSGLSWEEMAKGLVGVGAILLALTLFTKFSGADKGGLSQGAGLVLLAVGIKILAGALVIMGNMSWEQIGKGLATLGGALLIIGGALKLIPASSLFSAAAVLIIATSLGMIGDVLKTLGSMSWEQIGKGLASLAGALSLIANALILIPPSSLLSAAAILVVAASLGMIVTALTTMGGMTWEQIAKGLVTLAAALGIIALAVFAMKSSLLGAAAIILVAGALKLLAPVLMKFGNMSWEEMGKGLLMLAGVFAVIGIAGLLLTPIMPTLLGLGIAIGLMGVGMVLAGAGLLLFSMGLTALAASGTVAVVAIVAIVTALIGLIPMVLTQIGIGLIALIQVIAESSTAIVGAIVTILLALIQGIITLTPPIVNAILVILLNIITGLTTLIPVVVTLILTMLMRILTAIANAIPALVSAGMRIITGLLQGITKNLPSVIMAGTNLIIRFIEGIGDASLMIVTAAVDTVITFVNGLSDAIDDRAAEVGKAAGKLMVSLGNGLKTGLGAAIREVANSSGGPMGFLLNKMADALGVHSPSTKTFAMGLSLGQGLSDGLDAHSSAIAKSASGIGYSAIDAMRKSISGISDFAASDMNLNPTISPVLDLTEVKNGAGTIGSMLSTKSLSVGAAYSIANDASTGYQNNKTVLTPVAPVATAVPVSPRPIDFHIANIQDGDSLLRRARATNKMVSLAEGGDSTQIERIS